MIFPIGHSALPRHIYCSGTFVINLLKQFQVSIADYHLTDINRTLTTGSIADF